MFYNYIVGLSGGPDSVALLHWLKCQDDSLLATHCNFHLRGEESDHDEAFCRDLCRQLGITLLTRDFDTRRYMEEHHVSLELAARELRYGWWRSLLEQHPEASLAIGHHQDDSIETVLFNLMRGTGIKGLTGIPSGSQRIIRPLLSWTRSEVLAYLSAHNLGYITDSSNLEDEATRNRIRHHLLPLMEQILPQTRQGIAHTVHLLQQTRKLAEKQLDLLFASTQERKMNGLSWREFRYDPACGIDCEFLFHEWTSRYATPDTPSVRHEYFFYTHPASGDEADPRCHFLVETCDTVPPFSSDYQLFDLAKVTLPLVFRHWKKGDRIAPLGMSGKTRLVSDIFSDAHLSPVEKDQTWIVTDADDVVLWVVGHKVGDTAKITKSTQKALCVRKLHF